MKRKPNLAALIAAQAGVACKMEGTYGVAKTKFVEAISKEWGRKFYAYVPSQHPPEDAGGIPVPNEEERYIEMLPMPFFKAMQEPGWVLFIDEITTCDARTQALLLTMIEEKKIGSLHFHPDTIVMCACNPDSVSPNGLPLSQPVNNRLYHHEWEFPFADWYDGMMKGGDWSESNKDYPMLPESWENFLPQWCSLIARLCKKHQEVLLTTEESEEYATPSPRAWYKLARCIAAAHSLGLHEEYMHEFATGLVGEAGATCLAAYWSGRKAYDPAEVLDGTVKVTVSDDALDQLIYLPMSLLEELAADGKPEADGRFSKDYVMPTARLNRACEVLADLSENSLLNCAAPALREIKNTYCSKLHGAKAYKVPAKINARLVAIAKKVGGVK
jgi:MoxR-like ATPase